MSILLFGDRKTSWPLRSLSQEDRLTIAAVVSLLRRVLTSEARCAFRRLFRSRYRLYQAFFWAFLAARFAAVSSTSYSTLDHRTSVPYVSASCEQLFDSPHVSAWSRSSTASCATSSSRRPSRAGSAS